MSNIQYSHITNYSAKKEAFPYQNEAFEAIKDLDYEEYELENKIFFRTSKNSTVWAADDDVSHYLNENDPSLWADPYLVPLCTQPNEDQKKVSELRRGQLVFLKPAEHVKAFDTLDVEFDWGVKAHYDFYEKEDLIVVIPSFDGNDFLRNLSYRYSISRWTYEKFLRENRK